MNCPKCGKPVEPGALFCGNCGQPLQVAVPQPAQPVAVQPVAVAPPPVAVSPVAQVYNNQPTPQTYPQQFGNPAVAGAQGTVPAYAVAAPGQHVGETKAVLSLIFGILGIVGALLVPLIGIAFGITGIVLGTMSRQSTKKGLSTAGIILSTVGLLAGLATWAYAISQDPTLHHQAAAKNSGAVSSADVSTPCYSTGFTDKLNVKNVSDSCDMSAYNGTTLEQSTNAYKVYGTQATTLTTNNFTTFAKQALEKDVKESLPDFTINTEKVQEFAGSPAYVVTSTNAAGTITVAEAAVLHATDSGDNLFVLVHAKQGNLATLSDLEGQWQWK